MQHRRIVRQHRQMHDGEVVTYSGDGPKRNDYEVDEQ
jgi:hypothetical protein